MLGKFPGESVACITAGIKQKEFMRFRTGPGDRVGDLPVVCPWR